MSLRRLLVSALLACCATPAFAAQPTVAVTTCGQEVPRRTMGYLTGDLDCSGANVIPVLLNQNATLELRGFRITGGIIGVLCGETRLDKFGNTYTTSVRRCTIVGGAGTISAPEAHGIAGEQVTVSDLTIENAGQEGIEANRKATLTNVTVTGSADIGIRSLGPAKLTNVTVSGSGLSGLVGLRTVRVFDSTLIGNGGACENPAGCFDLVSAKRPQVDNTQCDTSGGNPKFPYHWGVCAAD